MVGNESPNDTGGDEEDGRRDRRIVVTELADQGGRGEGSCGTGDLVHDVHDGIHLSKLRDIATDNVSRDDPSDQLDHTVGNTRDDIDREETVGVPCTVLGLASVGHLGLTACGSIADEQDGRDHTEHDNGAGEDGSRRHALDQRGDEDGTDLWEGGSDRGDRSSMALLTHCIAALRPVNMATFVYFELAGNRSLAKVMKAPL